MSSTAAGPAPAPSRPALSRTLILVSVTSLLTDLSSEMVYPLLPLLVVGSLGASATVLGIIEGLAESIPALLKLYSGYVSDRVGRRKPLAIGGYTLSTLGKLCLAVATGPAAVFAGRVVDRFGKGIRAAPRDALIADSTPADQRGHAFGFHRMMDTAGAALGVLAAYLALTLAGSSGSALWLALWISVVPAAIAVAVLGLVRETGHGRASAPAAFPKPWRAWSALNGRLRAFLLICFAFALAGSTNQFPLLRAQQLLSASGLGPIPAAALVCLLYLLYNSVYTVASWPFGRLSDRFGRKPVLVLGYMLYAAVYAGFALNESPNMCWALFAVYGLFPALTEGVEKALVTDLAPRESRATLLGLHGSLQGIGLLPASVIGGVLWDRVAPWATFGFAAVVGLAAAIALAILPAGARASPGPGQLPDGRSG